MKITHINWLPKGWNKSVEEELIKRWLKKREVFTWKPDNKKVQKRKKMRKRKCYPNIFSDNKAEEKQSDIKVKKKRLYSVEFKRMNKRIRAEHKHCEQCPSDKYLMLHHIDKDIDNNIRENLVLLCFDCHKKHHKHLIVPHFMKK